jgi:hypothetical protein
MLGSRLALHNSQYFVCGTQFAVRVCGARFGRELAERCRRDLRKQVEEV